MNGVVRTLTAKTNRQEQREKKRIGLLQNKSECRLAHQMIINNLLLYTKQLTFTGHLLALVLYLGELVASDMLSPLKDNINS